MGRVRRILGQATGEFNVWKFSATNYTQLLTKVGMISGDVAKVYNSQGTKWLPGVIGGNFFSKGWYVFDGVNWVDDLDEVEEQFSKLPDNLIIIKDESQFNVVGGKNVIENGINYEFGTNFTTLTRPFDLSQITSIASIDFMNNIVSYTGPGALFQGTYTGAFLFTGLLAFGDGTNSVWDVKGNGISASNILVARFSSISNFGSIGIVDTIGAINHQSVQYSNCGKGVIYKDITLLTVEISPRNNVVSSESPAIVLDGTFNTISINSNPLVLQNLESYLQISKNIVIGEAIIEGNIFTDALGGEFLASDKTGGTTAYADNGSGGTTVTSVAHGLTIEQVVEITGSGVGAYDAIHQDIFNITVNTFDIPVAFVSNPATGDFDTGDSNAFLDAQHFSFIGNGDQINTNEICKYKSVNTINVVIAAANTPVNIVGVAGDWVASIERRFQMNFPGDPAGTIRYLGEKDLSVRISARITVDVVGGSAKEMTGYLTLNGVTQLDSRFTVELGRPITLNPEDIFDIVKNDVIGSSIENNDDSTNIDVIFVNHNVVNA